MWFVFQIILKWRYRCVVVSFCVVCFSCVFLCAGFGISFTVVVRRQLDSFISVSVPVAFPVCSVWYRRKSRSRNLKGDKETIEPPIFKEGNVLFKDKLNTFYLRLYGVGHMVKDHSDSERWNPLPPHGLLFPISSEGCFICIIPQTGYHIPRSLLHQSLFLFSFLLFIFCVGFFYCLFCFVFRFVFTGCYSELF